MFFSLGEFNCSKIYIFNFLYIIYIISYYFILRRIINLLELICYFYLMLHQNVLKNTYLTHLQIMFPGKWIGVEFLVGWRRSTQISDDSAESSTVVPVRLKAE